MANLVLILPPPWDVKIIMDDNLVMAGCTGAVLFHLC